jgi:DNA repair protein RadA/Sms
MSKSKKIFFCKNCGAETSQWQGQCNSCKEWNTIVEEVIEKTNNWKGKSKSPSNTPSKIDSIDIKKDPRINSHDPELNRVLGGGIVPGSLVLLGGEPGIGKSTLLLQVSLKINGSVLYVSGEESGQQIKLRALRIQDSESECFILCETNTQNIFKQIDVLKPLIVIIDSIQTLYSNNIDSGPGSISQLKSCAAELIQFAKETHTPVFLVGHITKDGNIAGPKILEHMVDTVLQFEGDRNHTYRILRAKKNRFGSTSEIGIYEMISKGLRPVLNPSELLISEENEKLSGNAISATIEGSRPLMIEIQSLVSTAVYGTPQRSSNGFNAKRLNMLLAILEKRAGFALGNKDVFINITGGISVIDPATDLAVTSAILSSYKDIAINKKICFAAEIGLSGEIRPVSKVEQRIKEAEKLGYDFIIISKFCKINQTQKQIQVLSFSRIESVIEYLFQ